MLLYHSSPLQIYTLSLLRLQHQTASFAIKLLRFSTNSVFEASFRLSHTFVALPSFQRPGDAPKALELALRVASNPKPVGKM